MRKVFDKLSDLRDYLRNMPPNKQTPFKVTLQGHETVYVLASNTDQAIAGAARKDGAEVESVPIMDLLKENHN